MLKFLHHLFLPKESNNHRAKLLHHDSLLIILVFLLSLEFFFIATEKKYTGVLGITSNITVQELIDQTNQKRAENHEPPLSLNSELASAATAKAADMFSKNYWAHFGPDGESPWGFIRSAGYEYIYAGENLARGFTTTTDVINAWMASPGHRENMLSPNYKDVGFAIQSGTLTGDDTVLVVEEFGSQASNPAPQEVSAQVAPSPTPTISLAKPTAVIVANLTTTPGLSPTAVPTYTPLPSPIASNRVLVAGVHSDPLIDSNSLKRQIVLGILAILIATMIVDVILIERRKITRLFVHNIDHIIYFGILFIAILLLTRGAIL